MRDHTGAELAERIQNTRAGITNSHTNCHGTHINPETSEGNSKLLHRYLCQKRPRTARVLLLFFYLNSQYQTGNKPNYMEANKGMLRMRHWGGCYFKWKILIPGGTKNRYNENLKRPWYCRLPCWKQLHGEGKTTRKTFYLMYWTNRANRKRPFVICLYILSVCVGGGGGMSLFLFF